MNVAIIKYNSGNIQSVSFALERLGINPVVSDVLEEIQKADKVIFPGVVKPVPLCDILGIKIWINALRD